MSGQQTTHAHFAGDYRATTAPAADEAHVTMPMERERRYHAAGKLADAQTAAATSSSSVATSPQHSDDPQRLLRSVDSASSLSSTVYDDDEQQQQLHPRPGSAPPNLNFESSAFFNFGGPSAFFSHMKYDDELAGDEFPEDMGPTPSNNNVLPPVTNQASHSEPIAATAGAPVGPQGYPKGHAALPPNHRKNSIEMFLSQSPSQSLGGDFLKLSLDDRSMSLRANELAGGTSAFASGHFTLNPVGESPKKFGRTGSLRLQPQQQQERFVGGMDVQQPMMSRSSSASSYSNYQLSPRAGSEDSWHGSQDGGQQSSGAYYQEQEYYGGGQAPQYGREQPQQQQYYYRQQQQEHGMYRNQNAYGGGYGNNGRTNQSGGQWNPNFVPSGGGGYNANGMYMTMQSTQLPQQMHYQQGGMRGNSGGGRGNRQNSHGYARMTPPLPEASPPHSPRKSMGMAKQCKFFLQGHCRMGSKCKFAHLPVQNQHLQMPQHMGQHGSGLGGGGMYHHQQLQMSPLHHQGGDDMPLPFSRQQSRGGYQQSEFGSVRGVGGSQSGGISVPGLISPGDSSGLSAALSVEDIQGRVFAMSKDQNGCRLLQEQLDYEDRKDLSEVIYQESLDHLAEMMVDPFGNYLFQKLLERVTEKKRLAIIRRVSSNLVAAALNLHGTRSVQKVVEVCATSAEVIEDDDGYDDGEDGENEHHANGVRRTVNLPDIIVEALKDDAVRLCIDSNGNHVIQRALQYMKPEYNQFVFDAVCKECTTVGTHRHGCCVLQRCLDAANKQQKAEVIAQVEKQAMKLMQDPYGNYVVQYVLDSCTAEEAYGVIVKPLGSIFELSVQKFSSNVIEKCLEKAPERVRQNYIKEIINCPKMNKMLQDQFANYVVQRALCVCSEEQCLQLVKAIRPHLAVMKNTSGGRRITARILKRFPNMDISLDMGLSPTHDGMYETNSSHLQLSRLPPSAANYGHHASGGYPLLHGHGMPVHSSAHNSSGSGGYSSHHHHHHHHHGQHGGGLMSDVVGSGLGVNAAGTSRA